jgi:chromosome partitioning protein
MLRRVDDSQVPERAPSAHVVVLGNEKGGSGKTTLAIHVAVALMKAGQCVATIDLDSHQQSFTHCVNNRRAWAARGKLDLDVPDHFCIAGAEGLRIDENEAVEFANFAAAITAIEHTHDFVVIDTPASDTYLNRLAHSMADTLITPMNDSFVDLDVLAIGDPQTFAVTGVGHYGQMVREARRQRRNVDGAATDWIVVRNRLSQLSSRNKKLVGEGVNELARQMGFRFVDGLTERVVYREFFPRGLTALDNLNEATVGTRPAHLTEREEVEHLLAALNLPINQRGLKLAEAKMAWLESAATPLDVDDILTNLPAVRGASKQLADHAA